MAILSKNGLSGFVKILLDIIFVGGVLIYITLPWCLKWYLGTMFSDPRPVYGIYLFFLYFTGVFSIYIVFEMRRIFRNLSLRQPFVRSNVSSLVRVGYCCLVIAGAYVVKLFLVNTIFTIVAVMIFIIAGLFALVLSEVFRQAIEVKEEMDLTI